MDFYSFFKLLHVLCAIAWVGGGLTLLVSAVFNIRDRGPAEAIRASQLVGSLAMRWFLPASGLTFVFGAIVTVLGGLWSEAWVIIGLAGFASTFLTGHFVLRVKAEQMGEMMRQGREPDAIEAGLELMRVSKFDYTVILVVVADMVLKPGWTDFVTLGLFAAALAAGAYFFLFAPQAEAQPTSA